MAMANRLPIFMAEEISKKTRVKNKSLKRSLAKNSQSLAQEHFLQPLPFVDT